ncbi:zinc-dependent metalloprotease [Vibrio sp. Of7-15]|uniref:zinc-dependent metalloprotease n=1 Tax=Vibrio sp. Of7-15 TaxID=2724879 RepID=UPI001EF2A4DB|nr:zinc-dependent metalloprotease [Vibrio sp. Of7-15]MCG7497997.1 zinc-dependent metalloprotease [Vibrio sp. Of7-15]
MTLTRLSLALTIALTTASASSFAEDTTKTQEKKEQTLVELLADKKESKGLLNFYQDKKTGETLMLLNNNQLDVPMLYFAHTVDGVTDAGHFRGKYRETKIIEFRRHFDRIDIITKTPRYKFDQENPISKASDANISEAVLASIKIEKEEQGQIALKVDKLFLSESLHKISPWSNPDKEKDKYRFELGKLDDKKSRILNKRTYDDNVDVVVDYVFSNTNPKVYGSHAVSDPRAVSLKIQHSFVKLPDNNFQPRLDDARIGYFTEQYNDMTSSDWAPYQDVINRWNLEKKDPNAALSEPVKPIVWWIENTTPHEWRNTIKEAVLSWNIAFEKAGFKNALQVKVQPDDATWDAGDINYNVLRWTSSPRPPFGGYGPSLANPLTGEILGADIMLEFVFMKNRWIHNQLFSQGASSLESMPIDSSHEHSLSCSAGHELQHGLMFAKGLTADDDLKTKAILEEGLRMLILHEVGHTLGLNHNMKASILWDEKEIHNKALTQGVLTGSVMDYTPANVAPLNTAQGDYFQTKPGPYDIWAIEYGYSPALDDTAQEQQRLNDILSRSSDKGHAFGNDADDMRQAGRHIDPRVMISDMSSNPIAYATDRMALINNKLKTLKLNALQKGESHHSLLISANVLYGQYRRQAEVISRHIGGVYVERDVVGGSTSQPYTPVPLAKQKEAMSALTNYVFAPDTLAAMQPLYTHMQHQRRSFNHYGRNEDPKAHKMLLNMQKSVLDHLLHQNVLQRLSDTALYGNEYSLNTFMNDLSAGIFTDKQPETSISQNLQIEYVQRLIKMLGTEGSSDYHHLAKSSATYQLQKIRAKNRLMQDTIESKAHQAYLELMIKKALEA